MAIINSELIYKILAGLLLLGAGQTAYATNLCDMTPQLTALSQIEQQIDYYQLENGIQVRLLQQVDSQSVSIASQFAVGSRNEQQGQTGYAHLFEHLLFKGSEQASIATYPQQMSAVGARFNASTHFDYTNYYATYPSQAIELNLFLESDRFIRPIISPNSVTNQQGAVLEEMAGSIDNQPYIRKAMEFLLKQVNNTPYDHAIIGSAQDVKAATAQSLQQFHQTFYRPDAMQLSLVGQLASNTAELIEHYFGQWPKPTASIANFSPLTISASAQHGEIVDSRGPWPAVLLAWHTVGRQHIDAEALSLLSQYLFQYRASLLAKSQQTHSTSLLDYSIPLTMEMHGVTNIVLVPRANESLDSLTQMITQLINQVAEQGIPADTLCRLKTSAINKHLSELSNHQNLAIYLSNSQARDTLTPLTAPWQRVNQVSPQDIQRVAKQYLLNKQIRLDLLPPWYIRFTKTLLEWLPQSWTDSLEGAVL
ncbi:M16 family metallopeptidase [Shewanella aestuarii]|uniref:Insulinase family protein n=1 Tax=Shewanella aestuarii TaxID=1028752 RepID=A0A6G9QGJ4_9GAMM|nr:pitrilysin family protein [Shewanella aestuarii]QIR13664.1 insulinase family protein [Shewanella aestuarii]